MTDFLLTTGDALATRENGLVVGACPECCGGPCGEGCCGATVPGLPGVVETCGFPRVNGVLDQQITYAGSGAFNQSGPGFSLVNNFNLSGTYLSPPAAFSCNAAPFVTDNTPSDLRVRVGVILRPVGGGAPIIAPNQRYDGRWVQQASGFPGALIISVFPFVGNLPGQATIAVARFMGVVPPGEPAWGVQRTFGTSVSGNTYTWGAVSVNPTFTPAGCLRSVSGGISQSQWVGTEPGATFVSSFAFSFALTMNTELCCGADSLPDLTDTLRAL